MGWPYTAKASVSAHQRSSLPCSLSATPEPRRPAQLTDHRLAFSKWWVSEWKGVQFPEKGSVYDYYVDPENCLMVPWDEKVPSFSYAAAAGRGGPLFVPTIETARLTYFLDSLMANRCARPLREKGAKGRARWGTAAGTQQLR